MDVHNQTLVLSLKININREQKELIEPLNILYLSIRKSYQQFLAGIRLFNEILEQPEKHRKTVLFQGLSMLDSLRFSLDTWEMLYQSADLVALSESLKEEDVLMREQNAQWYAFSMEGESEIEIQKKAERKDWPRDIDLYQKNILENIWKLKWEVYSQWNHCLAYIDYRNNQKNNTHPLGASSLDEPLREAYQTAFNVQQNALRRHLNSYLQVFNINHVEMVQELSNLERLSKDFYQREMISFMGNIAGLDPTQCLSACINLREVLLAKIDNQFGKLHRKWYGMAVDLEELPLMPNFLVCHSLSSSIDSEIIIQEEKRSLSPAGSVIFGFEKKFMNCLLQINEESFKLIRQYAKIIYDWSFNNVLHRSNRNRSIGFRPLGDADTVFGSRSKFIELLGNSKRNLEKQIDFRGVDFSDPSFKKQLRVTPQEEMLLRRLESICLEVRQNYNDVFKTFDNFLSRALYQINVLQQGLALLDTLNQQFDKIRASRHFIAMAPQILYTASSVARNKNYWIFKDTPSIEKLIEQYKLEKEAIRQASEQRFTHQTRLIHQALEKGIITQEQATQQRYLADIVRMFQTEQLYMLLDLELASSRLFFCCIDRIEKNTNGNILDSLSEFNVKLDKLIEQLEKYKQLFSVSRADHFYWMKQLLELRRFAYKQYQSVTDKNKKPSTNSEYDYDLIAAFIASLKEFHTGLCASSKSPIVFPTVESLRLFQKNIHSQPKLPSWHDEEMLSAEVKIRVDSMKKVNYVVLSTWMGALKLLDKAAKELSLLVVLQNYMSRIGPSMQRSDSLSSLDCTHEPRSKIDDSRDLVVTRINQLVLYHRQFSAGARNAYQQSLYEALQGYLSVFQVECQDNSQMSRSMKP